MSDRTPAGWYRDASAVNTQRYWDGEQWTEQVQPLADPSSGVTRGILMAALILGGIVFVCAILYGIVHANDDLECAINGQTQADCR